MNKEIKIQIPEGFDGIDEEKSDLANGIIVFKEKKDTVWRNGDNMVSGYWVSHSCHVSFESNIRNVSVNHNVFATEKQAKSMIAMAQLSQIIENDSRFGGPITDKEWNNPQTNKYVIIRKGNDITTDWWKCYYHFLAFHTREQQELFMEENMDLIRQYYMLD